MAILAPGDRRAKAESAVSNTVQKRARLDGQGTTLSSVALWRASGDVFGLKAERRVYRVRDAKLTPRVSAALYSTP